MSADSKPSSDFPVPHRPAPWTTKAEAYWMFIGPMSTIPEGSYSPLEARHAPFVAESDAGKFKGGLGFIMIVRYSDTPCGTYDELLICPGDFSVPGRKKADKRITRIYVNQKDTTFNGRYNWNIPKRLARFEFSSPMPDYSKPSPPPQSLHVAVYSPDPAATTPFFSATLTPFRLIPAIPFSSRYLPINTDSAQPPLPAAQADDDCPKGEDPAVIIGTKQWAGYPIEVTTPRARGMWVEMHYPRPGSEEETEAKKWWPVNAKPWSIGAWLEDATQTIGAPERWE